jgi:hypothetical protein
VPATIPCAGSGGYPFALVTHYILGLPTLNPEAAF